MAIKHIIPKNIYINKDLGPPFEIFSEKFFPVGLHPLWASLYILVYTVDSINSNSKYRFF
jgi:hypothetical protein